MAVGGTQFNENGQASTYWNTVNGSDGLSVKSYIPENVWNQSCTSAQCDANANILAGGGGASTIFSKPSWQSGVTGIPTDGARDLPDVSLSAAGHDPYLLCYEGSCQTGFVATVFGTSASAPSFAGIMALVNQKTGSRQGQANYVLYRLAAAENSLPVQRVEDHSSARRHLHLQRRYGGQQRCSRRGWVRKSQREI